MISFKSTLVPKVFLQITTSPRSLKSFLNTKSTPDWSIISNKSLQTRKTTKPSFLSAQRNQQTRLSHTFDAMDTPLSEFMVIKLKENVIGFSLNSNLEEHLLWLLLTLPVVALVCFPLSPFPSPVWEQRVQFLSRHNDPP